jgi:lipopolysaccharide export LptBFGC system permease protein LptF
MRTIKCTLLMALLLIAVMPACKKGENDPFISMRSRKARVAGEWKVVSGTGTQSYTFSSSTSNSSWTYDGTTYTETDASGSTSRTRTMEYTFEKDGTFTHSDLDDGVSYTGEGNWNFSQGVGETKGKSELVLSFTKTTSPTGTSTFDSFFPWFTYEIVELRNKKMVLKSYSKRTESNGDISESTEEYVLEPK